MDLFKTLRERIAQINDMLENRDNSLQFENELKCEKRATIHSIREVQKQMALMPLESILESVYNPKLSEEELSLIVMKIKDRLEDSFDEDPPNRKQSGVIGRIFDLSEDLKNFF